jgi:hypothetical protein
MTIDDAEPTASGSPPGINPTNESEPDKQSATVGPGSALVADVAMTNLPSADPRIATRTMRVLVQDRALRSSEHQARTRRAWKPAAERNALWRTNALPRQCSVELSLIGRASSCTTHQKE